ncbi:hypothetical protein NDU88_002475 [Pleurodeles waltl]|uniref:Reverse transcriptase RNase H-like domain-containing protein n=1 Tax=Pleurodeles waltl TaxID=8319 RepID=A0AAV7VCM7_PLEWA|nr:hypothetical protein NDU88_002475 [Pleurodeles waltl]
MESLRYYLLGRTFTFFTDHVPLAWVAKHKDSNARVLCWFLSLKSFSFQARNPPGRLFINADFLSRFPGGLWPKRPLSRGSECDGASSTEAAPRCPGGTPQSAGGPGDPSGDDHPDPEALLGAAGSTEDVGASVLFKGSHHHTCWQPPATEEGYRRPADSIQEEDRGQLTPQEARNQKEACAEALMTDGSWGIVLNNVASTQRHPCFLLEPTNSVVSSFMSAHMF